MATEIERGEDKRNVNVKVQGSPDSVYGLGVIGAWVYYMKSATTFREGAIGFFKGLVWPAIVVYKVLVLLGREDQGR